jgi:hypothetical protein
MIKMAATIGQKMINKTISKNDQAPAFALLRRGRRMTNDEGMTKLE